MTEALGRLVTTLDVIGLEAFVPEPPRGPGRPPEDRRALARAFVAKAMLGIPTTSALISDSPSTSRCGVSSVGSDARKCPQKPRFPRLRGVRAGRSARMHAALIERDARRPHRRRDRPRPTNRGAREAGDEGDERQQRRSAAR